MKRIRSFGLAAVLALALAATVGVASASATQGFFAGVYPATIDSVATENHELHFPASTWGVMDCWPHIYNESLEASTNALALGGESSECTNSQTMKMNGCQLIFHKGDEAGTDTVDIGPPGCGPITISGYYCGYQIGAQTGLAANIENLTNKEFLEYEYLRAEIKASGLQYTTTGAPTGCHKGTYSNGGWSGAWKIIAEGSSGVVSDLHTATMAPLWTEDGKWQAPSYPATVSGEQSASDPLVFGFKDGITVQCESSSFSSSLEAASKSLLLGAGYSGCEHKSIYGSIGTTIKMNSCAFELNPSSLTSAKVDIECGNAGDVIEFIAVPCRYKIGAQQNREAVVLANNATGVEADVQLKGISYEAIDGFACPLNGGGQFSNGTYDGTMTLTTN